MKKIQDKEKNFFLIIKKIRKVQKISIKLNNLKQNFVEKHLKTYSAKKIPKIQKHFKNIVNK